jgi:hypothetical protein
MGLITNIDLIAPAINLGSAGRSSPGGLNNLL